MIYVVVIISLFVLMTWGISEATQNYAMAKQAEATIEVARAAKVASYGNLLVIALVVLVILLLIAAVIYGMILLNKKRNPAPARASLPYARQPQIQSGPDINQITQLLQLQILSKMAGVTMPQLEEKEHEE